MSIRKQINEQRLPTHVAVIMDGNGRWAQKQNLHRTLGHKKGIDAVEEVLEAASLLQIKALTLYAFSTENWKRSDEEISYIFKLPKLFYQRLVKKLHQWNVKIKWIGEHELLPQSMKNLIADFESQTEHNTGLVMYLAFNYGSRAEITHAMQSIGQKLLDGSAQLSDITEAYISSFLYTSDVPEVDLVIRTSGEYRLSNFLLWQCAYAELYFMTKHWPEFTKEDFYQAIYEYQQRHIRKGGV